MSPPKPRASGRPGVRPTSDLVRGVIFDMLDAMGADYAPRARSVRRDGRAGHRGAEPRRRRRLTSSKAMRADGGDHHREPRARRLRVARPRAPLDTGSRGRRLSGPYTLVLADPPYYDEGGLAAVSAPSRRRRWSMTATVLVLEHHRKTRRRRRSAGPLPAVSDAAATATPSSRSMPERKPRDACDVPGAVRPGHERPPRHRASRGAKMFDRADRRVGGPEAELPVHYRRAGRTASGRRWRTAEHRGHVVLGADGGFRPQQSARRVVVRSMRAVTDFEAEFDMALMNKKMAPEHRIHLS